MVALFSVWLSVKLILQQLAYCFKDSQFRSVTYTSVRLILRQKLSIYTKYTLAQTTPSATLNTKSCTVQYMKTCYHGNLPCFCCLVRNKTATENLLTLASPDNSSKHVIPHPQSTKRVKAGKTQQISESVCDWSTSRNSPCMYVHIDLNRVHIKHWLIVRY